MSRVVRRINGGSRVDVRDAGRRHGLVRAVRAGFEEHVQSPSPGRYLWRPPTGAPKIGKSASTRYNMTSRRRSPKGCAERCLRVTTSRESRRQR
jgi:hypothetical protein